jgi:hypothetical protein
MGEGKTKPIKEDQQNEKVHKTINFLGQVI